MSNLARFLKQNKKVKENTKYIATKSLCDENGQPLEWTIKPISTTENDAIRDSCTYDVPVTGKPNQYRQKVDYSKYAAKLIAASVVEPNLYAKELQDSYGVFSPEDLVREMIDDPGEYGAFMQFVNEFNGFTDINDKIEQAKN